MTVPAQTLNRSLGEFEQHPKAKGLSPVSDCVASVQKNRAQLLALPHPTCSGSIQRWLLRPGLDLVVHDVWFRDKTTIERNRADDDICLGLSYCLAGQIRGSNVKSEHQFQGGQATLGIINGSTSHVEYAAEQRVLLVHIHVRPDAIPFINSEEIGQLPRPLRDAIIGRDRPHYFQSGAMTPVMRATVQQLMACPYHGLSQQLYIEGKTLELIGLYFDQLLADHNGQQQQSGLSTDESDRIVYARDLLLSQLDNPPTLLALARQAGLNDRKLKQGFRQVFGTTVFGYLHNHRMAQAKQLLVMSGTTIAGVAQKVGYRNPEAFSAAFRRTFAINPKAYQLQQRG